MSVQFAEAGPGPKIDFSAFASRAKEIDIGGDDLQEIDDMGVGLLANPNKVAPSPKGMRFGGVSIDGGAGRQVSIGGGGGGGGGGEMPALSIKPVEDLEVVNLDMGPGVSDIKLNKDAGGFGGGEPAPFVINTGSGPALVGEATTAGGAPVMSAEEEYREKQRLLTKLQRLENDGLKGQRMTMANSLDEVKQEYEKLTDARNLEASIRFQRNALMTFVTGVEMVNDKVGHRLPVKPRLKGWSESVHTNIEDFDSIFEELYDLYKDSAKMHPLLRLVGTLGVSATMYHLTNSAAERSGIPGMQDILHEDPELQQRVAAAMMRKMGGLGQFMNAAGGGPGPMPMGGAPPMGGSSPGPTAPPPMTTPFNMAAAAGPSADPPRARREMRGPTGVDDILRAFEAERANAPMPPVSGVNASVFTPAGPPPTPPRGVSILRGGVDPLAEFLDEQSVESGSTMNTERRRGRRRAAPTPIGATLNLNV
jgi:hypothetical protein